jgi:EAL domain-containing protein (putative c-di-GMP-specific phosphodiesterase class I)
MANALSNTDKYIFFADLMTEITIAHLDQLLDGKASTELRAVSLPIFNLQTLQVCGYEMLVRVPHPFVNPEHLFAEAARFGLLTRLDELCLRATLKSARLEGPGNRLHFNIFQQTLLSKEPDYLLALLQEHVPEGTICFELIESSTMLDQSELVKRIEFLQNHGIQFALDDVGFGSSAVETLITLEPELIKVDRSIVSGALGEYRAERRLARLVAVAHALGAIIIAEGVDTMDDVNLGRQLGIEMGQGLMTGPLPV